MDIVLIILIILIILIAIVVFMYKIGRKAQRDGLVNPGGSNNMVYHLDMSVTRLKSMDDSHGPDYSKLSVALKPGEIGIIKSNLDSMVEECGGYDYVVIDCIRSLGSDEYFASHRRFMVGDRLKISVDEDMSRLPIDYLWVNLYSAEDGSEVDEILIDRSQNRLACELLSNPCSKIKGVYVADMKIWTSGSFPNSSSKLTLFYDRDDDNGEDDDNPAPQSPGVESVNEMLLALGLINSQKCKNDKR